MPSAAPVATDPTSYDRVPYPSASIPQSHPNRLAAMGRLFGLKSPLPSRCRVLELGCADGANLLPMAEQYPESTFLGFDASRMQIAAGQKALAAAGLKNVELRAEDILNFTDNGRFDYIIAHGIFSWVPNPVREKILDICARQLTENGVAFISYNALPGWSLRRSLRDMMRFHTEPFADPGVKVQQARALLAFLSEASPVEGNAYGRLLKSELDLFCKQPEGYLLHEFLEGENRQFYFHEFVELAGKHGLQYLSESSLAQMLAENFSDKVRDTLGTLSKGVIAQEQYMDFLRHRTFRETLLCRSEVAIRRNVTAGTMKDFAFGSLLKRLDGAVDLRAGVEVNFPVQSSAVR